MPVKIEDNTWKAREKFKEIISRKLSIVGNFLENDIKLRMAGQYGAQYKAVRFGNLKESVTAREVFEENNVFILRVGSPVEYAPFVEYGTGIYNPKGRKTPWTYFNQATNKFVTTQGMPPRPNFRLAIIQNRKKIKEFMAKGNAGK